MAEVIIKGPQKLSGEVSAPPSKAYTHRMLVAALLSEGVTKIWNPLVSDDTQATLQAVEAFGANVKLEKSCWMLEGTTTLETPRNPVDCRESGTTLRFMIPAAALAPNPSVFHLGTSLKRRPIMPLLQSLQQLGAESIFQENNEDTSIQIRGGGIKGGKATIRGNISSQFISGLLFACPRAKEDTEITLTTPLESRSYVRMTKETLNKHRIEISISKDFRQLKIPSKQLYKPYNHEVPGDFSSAAFLLAAAAITPSKVKVKNLDCTTTQGDKIILDILEKMGSRVKVSDSHIEVEGKTLNAVDVDAKDIPDLVPVCAVLACYSKGISKIYNAERLKYKESNRLSSLYEELKKMGAEIAVKKDALTIRGPCVMRGQIINPHSDHRIAMACAVAALGANGETKIQNAGCIKKSYPTFFNDLSSLGVDVIGGQFDR